MNQQRLVDGGYGRSRDVPHWLTLVGWVVAASLTTSAFAAVESPATQPTTQQPTPRQIEVRAMVNAQDPAVSAMHLDTEGEPSAKFLRKHQEFLDRGKEGPIGVLFLGDSITAGWDRELFAERFGSYQPANFGISSDRTQHVLWRIANGELDNIHPKVVILLIGTNNLRQPPADVARGVGAVTKAIREKLPGTHVLVLGIFPRGKDPADTAVAGQRRRVKEINSVVATLADGTHVHFLDIGDRFLSEDGLLSESVSFDGVHLTPAGYLIWADAMQPKLDELLKR